MKKIVLLSLTVLFFLATLPSCSKGGGGNGGCSEGTMTITTSPAIGSNDRGLVGPNFPLQVNISANLPAAGVTIEVSAGPETGGTPFFTQSLPDVKTAISNFSITNTPSTTVCKVNITVTSKSCASNKWTGSYTYSKK